MASDTTSRSPRRGRRSRAKAAEESGTSLRYIETSALLAALLERDGAAQRSIADTQSRYELLSYNHISVMACGTYNPFLGSQVKISGRATDTDASATGHVLSDLRDLFLRDGFHYLIVGTPEVVRAAIAPHAQLRSVFTVSDPLSPLAVEEFRLLLSRRYRFLRLDPRKSVAEPVGPGALAELYGLFAGDLRGALNALDYAADLLLGYTGGKATSTMEGNDMHSVLRRRYLTEADARLSESALEYLETLSSDVDAPFTQTGLTELWEVSQAFVSKTLSEWQRFGYAREVGREGRRLTYELTGPARLMLSAQWPTSAQGARRWS